MVGFAPRQERRVLTGLSPVWDIFLHPHLCSPYFAGDTSPCVAAPAHITQHAVCRVRLSLLLETHSLALCSNTLCLPVPKPSKAESAGTQERKNQVQSARCSTHSDLPLCLLLQGKEASIMPSPSHCHMLYRDIGTFPAPSYSSASLSIDICPPLGMSTCAIKVKP